MVELVTRNFWWPGVTKEVKQYIEGCDACQQNKNRTEQPAGKLMPNSIPERPWTHISADFITKPPLAQGYDSILVVVDCLTKMVHFIPTTEKTSAEKLARLFRNNVWKLHGCKGTPNMPLQSPFQSSRATQKPIQYYYVILGLTPIIPRALHYHLAHFPCSDPGYQYRDAKTL